MKFFAALLASALFTAPALAQTAPVSLVLHPARVWIGTAAPPHENWVVVVTDGRIAAVGPEADVRRPPVARDIALPNVTLTPGLIDAHTHLLLRAYSIETWDDQVLRDSEATRVIRAIGAARDTLLAGFTAVRDLGTEGAGYADVSLRQGVESGAMLGPRLFVATRAIVARGAYAPRRTGFRPDLDLPQGAEEASGEVEVVAAVREQMAYGADWIKLYADYRFGNSSESRPTFTQNELSAAVRTAHDAGLRVAVHAVTDEGMRRAVLAGVDTIEHGYNGSAATFRLMAQRHVALVPTLTAADTVRRPDSAGFAHAFRLALAAHVIMGSGSDAGVFAHGQNARELELMVENGMTPVQAMIAATATDAAILGRGGHIGVIAPGAEADLAGFIGDPTRDITALRNVAIVVSRGVVVRETAPPA